MKKKITATLAAAAVLLASGCGNSAPAETKAEVQESQPAQTTTSGVTEPTAAQTEPEADTDETDGSKSAASLFMSVNGGDGKLSITRASKKSTPMGSDDTWTVFVYLCGTDLESEDGYGAATGDIAQMLKAKGSDNVRFVVQTGGTSQWANEVFSADAAERYVVQNQDIQLVDSVPLTNMGDPDTLSDFLDWGVKNYPAEKMGVVFWDHGGGSISGACFDELNESDSLYLAEINTAFSEVYGNMTDKFEFIGFDCCLMGTAETANILATYARYFYGSQESEPGTGWDYTSIGSFLAENPSANGAELGKVVTDSFYEECASNDEEGGCTFTIIDLEKLDDFTVAFNDYANALYTAAQSDLAGIVKGVNNADNFGGNNRSEGYTNMVDIGGIIDNCSGYADGSKVLEALDNCIVYNRNGSDHKNASGLSIYYPLQLQGTQELNIFSGICVSPYYLSLVDMVIKGYSDNGYTNEVFFTEDGDWYCGDCECESCEDYTYFDCSEEDCGAGTSSLITFLEKPAVDEDGMFCFILDDNGLEYAAGVKAYIYLMLDDVTGVLLGETYDVNADWNEGIFYDNFDGYWLALPDGQLLSTFVADYTDEYIVYTSPIELNGKTTNLRIRQYFDGTTRVEGAWDGVGEGGIVSREIKKLKAGDSIVPIYGYSDANGEDGELEGDEYIWTEDSGVDYGYLYPAEYYYGFDIEDVYGDSYLTDLVTFAIDEDGSISFIPD